jgi:hypothetical protein
MPDASKPATRDAAPADEKPTADQKAIEKAVAEQRKTLDEHEAAAYERAHGEPVKGE